MSREEQIIKIGAQFAIDETEGQASGRAASMRGILLSAFKAGAEWADQHPHWIPVEEELPQTIDWYLCYNDLEDGCEVLHWEGDGNVWMDNDWHYKSKEITHWMPLPEVPRKEENNESETTA